MLNPLNLLSKFLGSSNQKELNKIQKIVNQVNLLEEKVSILSNEDFPKKTEEFISQVNSGVSKDKIMPEAFALVREASKRILGESHLQSLIHQHQTQKCMKLMSMSAPLQIKTK